MGRTIGWFAVFLVCTVCGMGQSADENGLKAEDARVADALRNMYAAGLKNDIRLFHSVTAPGFYAFEGGKRYDGDAIFDDLQRERAAGWVFEWTVNDPTVHVDGNLAWITFTNRGFVQDPSGRKADGEWLDSAFLEKQDGQWRVRFFHGTRAVKSEN
jgi:hypothetical protein